MWWMWVVACTGGGAGAPDEPIDPVAWSEAEGPWRVGYRVSSVTYDAPAGTGERALRLALWYPTEAEQGREPRYLGLFSAPGVLDAPPAAPGPFPVVVFSHGHQGYAESVGNLMAFFASRGWVVAAPDHTGNTSFDGADRDTEIYFQRPADISAVLDHVLGGGEPDLPAVEPRVLGIGHSFGGYTMLALAGAAWDVDGLEVTCAAGGSGICSTWSEAYADQFRLGAWEDRISGVVLLAGGDFDRFGAAGIGQIEVPVEQMTGGLDHGNADDRDRLWDALPAPAWRAHTEHGGHQAWTDYAGVAGVDTDPGVLDG
ncbi:MAG TPA: alpha/beta fold hydrolase, partial [Myxococcota bacterium]|nr:alpha/beta fold hydrolase [Myxococcota bacterium]